MAAKYPGVFSAVKNDHTPYYRASLTYLNKHISLGSYNTPETAHDAYLEGCKILQDRTISLLHYQKNSHVLSFEKWVILINFRDNKIYISTPIYVRKNYFEYYFTPNCYLLFDAEDLFYYSSHKIIRRGGHMFVNEFGMQFNILNRYGIHSFSVVDRDYRFINGNRNDFRYENIEVISPYFGVYPVRQKNKTLYQAKIHIHGDYLIGKYTTLEEAAIAYNKAVDLIKKAGVNRQYMQNYIEGLSPATYAEIYTKCKISDKILYFSE